MQKSFLAPTGGWVTAANLAAGPDGAALVCENFLPTSTGLRMRGGSKKKATVAAAAPLECAMTYVGAQRKVFAAATGKVFDVTAPASPTAIPAPVISGQTSNYYSYLNFGTVGGNFMPIVNGTDFLQLFDGSTWQQVTAVSAPIAITGTPTNKLSHVGNYRNRLWFVEGGTMKAHYLPVDSIGGALKDVSLNGIFQRGGALLFTATWSMDAGNGLDDKIVFVSTEGEYAVYEGDPDNANTWNKVGLYDAAPPLGKNAYLKVGGDLLILTDIGLIPMSQIQLKDPAALALAAISRNIQPDWERDARQRRQLPWEIVKWTSRNVAFITCPVTGDLSVTPPWCYAVNLETGKWSKVTGWNTRCFALHDDWVYFGTNDGTLIQAEITGADDGSPIYYTYVGQMEHLGAVGRTKTVRQARAIFRAKNEFSPQLSVAINYVVTLPAPPNAAVTAGDIGEWDNGLWDRAKWDAGAQFYTVTTDWVSIGQTGFVHAPIVQIVSGSSAAPSAELVTFDVTYELGTLVG